jgi:hypothetical protein
MVHCSDVRTDLIMLAAAYRRLAIVVAAPKAAPTQPEPSDPDGRCSRFLQAAFREETSDGPPT